MPYILVRGSVSQHLNTHVSGLKANDIVQLQHFAASRIAPSEDLTTINYTLHPCVLLTALEVLGYSVVACCAAPTGPGGEIQYLWTLHKDFPEPEPDELNHH
ncbi:Hypothetical predicted protein [Cloeon dipterum]|uniref:GTP cyclohydrolase 1 feedback regulatory protein n=1 Tax=Cloeon dipterum TaxID=197152 RepID=A0A8S1DQR8_9INSE|nr:Hypothetical predicted protein [Cloeon dipterum]